MINHLRNAHSYIADFEAEHDLYSKSEALISYLDQRVCNATMLSTGLYELYVDLYERGYIEEGDITTLGIWIDHWQSDFTLLIPSPILSPPEVLNDMTAVVHVNALQRSSVPLWMSLHERLFADVRVYVPMACLPLSGIHIECGMGGDEKGYWAYSKFL
jgi:hypothetical protein